MDLYVRGLWTNGYGGVHGRWAGVSLGGGEKGREVVLGRNIEWGGLIYLGCYLLEKEGGGIIPINEGLGVWFSGQRRQACWGWGLRVVGAGYTSRQEGQERHPRAGGSFGVADCSEVQECEGWQVRR